MVNFFASAIFLLGAISVSLQESINLPDLDPQDAQQIIEQQDTSLKYAPQVDSNVPAVRYLGNEPHNVVEDIYLANQYHGQDGLGGYLYGYAVPDIAKTEKKQAGGDLRGAYNYIANGKEIKVEYWDDGTGFHQIDNVDRNPPEDLPAVKAEKERFLKRWQEEAERNSRPVEDPYNSEGQYKEGPLSLQGQLQRQQQFAAQFGKSAAYKQPEGAASQQSAIYSSNLEKGSQAYSSNYQPYQGRDQQNQGAYQSKQYSSYTKGPQAGSGFGQGQTGGYGSTGSGSYGAQSSGGAQSQSAYGTQGGYTTGGKANVGHSAGSGYGGQSSGNSAYGGQSPSGSSGYGSSGGYGSQPSGASNVGQSSSGYGAKPGQSSSVYGSSAGYGSQPASGAYGGQSSPGYGAKPGQSSAGYGGQPTSGSYGQGSSGYGSKPTGSVSGYGAQSSGGSGGYGSQPSIGVSSYGQGSSGYGAKPTGGASGYGGQSSGHGGSGGYGSQSSSGVSTYGQGSSGYGAKPAGGASGYGGQSASGYGQASGGYLGQSSQNVNKYAALQTSSYGQGHGQEEDDGSYKPEKDEEQGPPRGFFYKFDYPVGIIVGKQGPAQGGSYGQGGYQDQAKKQGSY